MSASTKRTGAVFAVILVVLLAWPAIPNVPYDMLNTGIITFEYLIAALSLVLLIGLVGQISLCQAALIGMGAFISAIGVQRFGIRFPWSLLIGIAAGAITASIIGVVALRVRGLYLAVATLIFAYICDQYFFVQPWLVQSQSGTSIPFQTIGRPGTIPSFNLGDAHVFYYVAFAVAAAAMYAVANLRDSRLGRAFAAVRGSEIAAASLGINVVRVKLVGFACAGALAGLSGALILSGSRTVAPEQFNFMNSLFYLSIAVVGGLRSIGGAIASSLLFAVLVGEVFFRSPTLADYLDVISAGLLMAVLLFFRGGLGAIPERFATARARVAAKYGLRFPRRMARDDEDEDDDEKRRRPGIAAAASAAVGAIRGLGRSRRRDTANQDVDAGALIDVNSIAARLGDDDEAAARPHTEGFAPKVVIGGQESTDQRRQAAAEDEQVELLGRLARTPSTTAGAPGADGRREPVLLQAENITVRFGGLVAVNDASLQVGAGEIVGLIGPNGAGKTTMFNSILGLNTPTAGRVTLFGKNVTSWEVHRRAALGVGRTFQILQLFGDLTVFDNLMVATHLQNRTGLWGGVVASGGALRAEAAAQKRVRSVLKLMELEDVADRQVAGLPFGVLRLIEVARTLVTGARLVCFDEPASGLDSSETERLLGWFRFLRNIGVTLLVIEHDVSFVVRLCDWIYVLDQGRLLAAGPPSQIQRDPAVIASYLGTPMEVA
jgi:ABC-type branched-subunit amino acid transport system ATPase component/ABC-type branched-subunit amino acid transport system permease subunit